MITKQNPEGWGIPLTNPFIFKYLVFWVSALLLSLVIVIFSFRKIKNKYSGYISFLLLRWKVLTFMVSGVFVSVAGYWADDETWDLISGSGMSVFTFLLVPLAVGICFRFLKFKESVLNFFLAIVF